MDVIKTRLGGGVSPRPNKEAPDSITTEWYNFVVNRFIEITKTDDNFHNKSLLGFDWTTQQLKYLKDKKNKFDLLLAKESQSRAIFNKSFLLH